MDYYLLYEHQEVADGFNKALEVSVDTFFYKKVVTVPWNIVWYNVFSGSGKGPNIYGTEPWHFYIRNLLLNFNIWFLLALSALPLLGLQYYFQRRATTMQTLLRSVIFTMPFYLWITIFTLQPHKEERFMYPVYPALGLNAAIALHMILSYVGSTDPSEFIGRVPGKIKLALVSVFMIAVIDAGILRTFGVVTAYSAPLKVYDALQQPDGAKAGDTVCFGKEWYRFSTSFLLPKQVRPKFIKSAFNGLLPGEFSEANVGFGIFPGASLIPPGMNDENKEDKGKYVCLASPSPINYVFYITLSAMGDYFVFVDGHGTFASLQIME